MRKLATIQTIKDLQPIEGADAIEVATVLGWHCVVKKGEFKIGDKCVYFEIDSLLPQIPQFEFMARNGTKTCLVDGKEVTGYRLKTVRLRGQISQGLAMPVTILPDGLLTEMANNHVELKDDMDVSDIIGVVKYEAPISASLSGVAKGTFPSFIPKTDEPRIQGIRWNIIERYIDKTFYVTEKIDGTSMTVYYKDGELNVCGRNINLKDVEGNTLWEMAKKLELDKKLERSTLALQGELFGEGIQSNRLKIKGHRYGVFNVYDFQAGRYYDFYEMIDFTKSIGVDVAPVIHTNVGLKPTVDEMVKLATMKSEINPDVWAEGLVFRPMKEVSDPDLGRLSFKVINPEFLLKHGE